MAVVIALIVLLAWAAPAAAQEPFTICHATGGNPGYITIVVPPGGLGPHANHEDDIIPAPEGGCPTATATPSPTGTPTLTATPSPTGTAAPSPTGAASPYASPTAAPTLTATPRPAATTGPGVTAPPPETGAEPTELSETAPGLRAAAVTPTTRLAATGAEPGLLALAGLGLLLCGCGLRLRTS